MAVVLTAYLALATHRIELPGLYMDAANPDYLVVKLINPRPAEPLATWVLPGNEIARRVPVLTSLYHGMQQFWLGLPLYAILGTDIVAVRLVHIAFALGVLVAWCALGLRSRAPLGIVLLGGLGLATDPAFVFAFRTQSYITLAPCAWLLASLVCLQRRTRDAEPRYFLSGLFYGLAVLGYFVYAFFLPAMVLAVDRLGRDASGEAVRPRSRFRTWAIGALAGCAYYAVGYALLAYARGGLGGMIDYLTEYQANLQILSSTLGLSERIGKSWVFLMDALLNRWHHSLMFGALEPVPFGAAKLALLVALPAAALLWRLRVASTERTLLVLASLTVSFFSVSLVFGDRLGGHHFIVLLPLCYAALVAALCQGASGGSRAGAASPLTWVIVAALIPINLAGQIQEFRLLEQTGGRGLYSNAVNGFARDLLEERRKPLVAFADWGLMMPITLLTGGTVPTVDKVPADKIAAARCAGRDVLVAAIGPGVDQRIEGWQRMFGTPSGRSAYRQRDGTIVFETVRFAASDRYCT